MSRKFAMMVACSAMVLVPVAPVAAQAPAKDVSVLVQQQWVPATQAEQQDARGGAKKGVPPKIKAIIKRIVCKRRGVGC